ncbi:uncharacterized protein ACO6RY_03112 [Pungitius sinensis]
MSLNSSSLFNASHLPPHVSSSNSSLNPSMGLCFNYRSSFLIFSAFCFSDVLLLLPLCLLVLYLGAQRWRQQRSKAASHCDIFTYHLVVTEMICVFGCALYCCATVAHAAPLVNIGAYVISVATNGQVPFHILTCVERRLAVVYPITYLRLRERGGVRIRNVAVGFAWLFFLGLFGVNLFMSSAFLFCLSVGSVVVISFCSLSVLRALVRPGPGAGAGGRERADQSKVRAFNIITAILGTHLFRLGGYLLVLSAYNSLAWSEQVRCDLLLSGVWFGLPGSLVLPLLYLHRAGKLLCCKNGSEQGSE